MLWWALGQVPELTLIAWLSCFGMAFNALSFGAWFDYEANRHLNPPLRHRDVKRVRHPEA